MGRSGLLGKPDLCNLVRRRLRLQEGATELHQHARRHEGLMSAASEAAGSALKARYKLPGE